MTVQQFLTRLDESSTENLNVIDFESNCFKKVLLNFVWQWKTIIISLLVFTIDIDVSESNKLKGWGIPDFVRKFSLGHINRNNLPDRLRSSSVENFLLTSFDGAITNWHIDFSNTSVFYIVLCGVKEFYVVPPTFNNQRLFYENKQLCNDKLV